MLSPIVVTKKKAFFSYMIVALFLFFEMAVQVSPSVMTNELMHHLTLGAWGLGLMSGFYFYTYTAMQIPSGLLFDCFQPRYVISLSILVCTIGCICFGLSTNIYEGSLARLLMGFGSAFAFVAVLVVTADLFESKYFALITGVTQMLAALGAISGQMPLRFAVEHLGWRATVFMLAGIGLILSIFVWILLNYKKDVLPCRKHTEKNKAISGGKGLFEGLVSNQQAWYVALYACLLWAPMSGFASLWGVPFLQHIYGFSQETAAWLCSMMWLGLAFMSPLLGWMSTAWNSRRWPLALSALTGGTAFGLLLSLDHTSPLIIGCLVFICGAACSGQALSFTVVKEIQPERLRATAIAFNNMAVVISGAIFQPLLGWLLDFQCLPVAHFAMCEARHYRLSMLLLFGAYIVAFVLATFFIRESIQTARPNVLLHFKR